jgi:hypothetical protein
MGGAGSAHRGGKKKAYIILVGKPEEKYPLEDLGIDGIILKWILKYDRRV